MPVPAVLALAASLAPVIPEVIGWIKGDDAKDRAEKIVDVAKRVTGLSDPKEAVNAINQNPDLAYKFQVAMEKLRLEFAREDTKRLQAINRTMQIEAKFGDRVQRWWRPAWGYISGLAFLIVMVVFVGTAAYSIVYRPESAVQTIAALGALAGALTPIWGIALAVLGVTVYKRSQDKQTAANAQQTAAGAQQSLGALATAVEALNTLRRDPDPPPPAPREIIEEDLQDFTRTEAGK